MRFRDRFGRGKKRQEEPKPEGSLEAKPTINSPNLQQILDQLSQPAQDPQDYSERIRLCQHALTLVDKDRLPQAWAGLQVLLGNQFRELMVGDRAESLEQAIAAYTAALEAGPRDAIWAQAQNNLGVAYFQRIQGDRAENLERSIAAHHSALRCIHAGRFPSGLGYDTVQFGDCLC